MFLHLFKYRLKVLSKKKALLFWTCAFPIILGFFFSAAFSGLDDLEVLETSEVAIVNQSDERTQAFTQILEELESGNKKLFIPVEVSSTEASKLLHEDKVSGIYTISDEKIDLKILNENIPQTILQSYLNQYLQNEALVYQLATSGRQLSENDWATLSVQKNYVQENEYSKNGSEKSFYFFTLIGMACMYGFFWGLRNTTDEQANQSANGIRLSMIPQTKLIVILANIAASFTLFITEIIVVLLIFNYVYGVEFGDRWFYIFITCALGSLNALAFGSFISNRFKIGAAQKEGIGLSFTMIMSVLAGMMGTTGLKYSIDKYAPILAKINPVNLIGESLYQLYYYQSLNPYFMNLFYLGLMTIFFTVFGFLLERRAQYDHL